ncbi:MAG: hypothetical protein FWD58_10970 [Firmicutes bacterium]|nr:hypothetical protein [Bacillota bacterium]
MAKKKNQEKLQLIVGLALTGLFVVTAILFTLAQFKIKFGSETSYYGFKIAFGKNGRFYFGLVFIFSLIGAVAASLAALKMLKIDARILYGACALLALGSVIIYLAFRTDIANGFIKDIDLSKILLWSFAFWGGFVLQILAVAGSVFGVATSKK